MEERRHLSKVPQQKKKRCSITILMLQPTKLSMPQPNVSSHPSGKKEPNQMWLLTAPAAARYVTCVAWSPIPPAPAERSPCFGVCSASFEC